MEPFYMFVLAPQGITGIGASFSRILQFIVCAGLCLKFFSSKRDRDRILNSFSPLNNNITYYFIFAILVGFLGFYTGSYSFNIEPSTQVVNNSIIADFIHSPSFRPLFEYFIAFYYFAYFVVLALYMLTSKEAIDYFFRIFGIAFLICIVLGYLDYLYAAIYWHETGGFLLPRSLADGKPVGVRFHGILGEPRDAFSYLMLSLGIFALRDIWEDKKKLTLFWFIFIAITAMLTQSFSGLIGIAFFCFFLLIFYIPNVSFYQNKDVQHFKVINKVLQSVDPEIQLFRDNNDFMPMLERIVSDLDNKTTDEFSDPIDSVWSVKILELASRSISESCKIDIPSEVG